MTVMSKRWYRSRRNQIVIICALLVCIIYYIRDNMTPQVKDLDIMRSTASNITSPTRKPPTLNLGKRDSIIGFIENTLEEEVRMYKGSGCEIPKLDPFAKEIMKFEKNKPKVVCKGQDWVRCYLSECCVIPEVLNRTRDLVCYYQDIVHVSDAKYYLNDVIAVKGADIYVLEQSDHVAVKCTATLDKNTLSSEWAGLAAGFRTTVERVDPPPGREHTFNVLIFGFDSTSKNGFIRRMPKSYDYLTRVMGAVVLNGYNIVGDGTPAALFPILTGRTELELPDVRRSVKSQMYMDSFPFIFKKLKRDGYRTAYFEDSPSIGTFQYRFNGFKKQPADHYLRSFYLENQKFKAVQKRSGYCLGDKPQYKFMMNITDQFLSLDGKRFCFTFVADITHNDFSMISTADDDTADFFKAFVEKNRREDTLLFVMGDHGSRFSALRETYQGKLEERLPLMAILLPDALRRRSPEVQEALLANMDALTTPHDIHATIMDVLGYARDDYKVPGSDLSRGMTLLEAIPRNRSCGEAAIQPHWCACLSWETVQDSDPIYQKTAEAFVDFVNSLTKVAGSQCIPRTLTSIEWVMRQKANTKMLEFKEARDADGYIGKFGKKISLATETYQIKVIVGPGRGVYEASMTYRVKEKKFELSARHISRISAYGNEPSCISATHPHLNMYCYCKDYV